MRYLEVGNRHPVTRPTLAYNARIGYPERWATRQAEHRRIERILPARGFRIPLRHARKSLVIHVRSALQPLPAPRIIHRILLSVSRRTTLSRPKEPFPLAARFRPAARSIGYQRSNFHGILNTEIAAEYATAISHSVVVKLNFAKAKWFVLF